MANPEDQNRNPDSNEQNNINPPEGQTPPPGNQTPNDGPMVPPGQPTDGPMVPPGQPTDAPMMPPGQSTEGTPEQPAQPQEKVYEMQWDCPTCGTTKLLGKTHRFCPNCGAPQDPDKRYFPSEEEKVAVQDHQFVGADKTCEYCGAANSATANNCTQCGGPMDGTESVKTVLADDQKPPPPPEPKKPMAAWLKWGLIGTAASIIGFCGAFLFWTKTVELEATSQQWVRTIEIEEKRSVRDSSWCPAPMGAYNVTRSREQKGTKKVPDGQTCRTVKRDRGDGTYAESQKCTTKYREEPVYDDKCYYKIDRWVKARTLTSSGGPSQAVTWPTVPTLRPGNSLGSQRVGPKSEKYTTQFKVLEDGETAKCEYKNPSTWKNQTVGSRWQGEMGVIGSNLECDELQKL